MKKKKVMIPLMVLTISVVLFSIASPKFFPNLLSGRVSFPDKYLGSKLTLENGGQYTVLRTLRVKTKNNSPSDYATSIVRFEFGSLSLETNKKLSVIPAPFLMGMPGFIEKNWIFDDETGEFQGIYKWESKAFADNYPDSFIFKLMTKRAAPGSLTYEVVTNTELACCLENLISD